MRSNAAQLCAEHGYPDELAELLEQAARAAAEHLGGIRSIVLSPSISCGDFLWKREDSGVCFLSDVDGFIFLEGRPRDADAYARAVRKIASGWGGPMFRIDLAWSPARRLGRLPETYQFAETRQAGFVLWGEPVLDRFPRRFDPRASRQAFLLNLWKPVKYCGTGSDGARAQAAARLLLDIPTLAASERGRCIPGHRNRARWFLDERPGPLGAEERLVRAVAEALRAREDPPGEWSALKPLLYPALVGTVEHLDGRGPPPPDPDAALVRRLAAWLPPRTLRRFLGECRTIARRPSSLLADTRWLCRRKEAIGGAALLGLLGYLADGRLGPAPPGLRALLGEFARRECSAAQGMDLLDEARALYRSGLVELYPSLAAGSD